MWTIRFDSHFAERLAGAPVVDGQIFLIAGIPVGDFEAGDTEFRGQQHSGLVYLGTCMETEKVVSHGQGVNPEFRSGESTLLKAAQIKTLPMQARRIRQFLNTPLVIIFAVVFIVTSKCFKRNHGKHADIEGLYVPISYRDAQLVAEGQVRFGFEKREGRKGERLNIVGGILRIHLQEGIGVWFCAALF